MVTPQEEAVLDQARQLCGCWAYHSETDRLVAVPVGRMAELIKAVNRLGDGGCKHPLPDDMRS